MTPLQDKGLSLLAEVKKRQRAALAVPKPSGCGCGSKTYRRLGIDFYKHCHCIVRLKDWCMETNWRNRNPKDGPIKSALKALTA